MNELTQMLRMPSPAIIPWLEARVNGGDTIQQRKMKNAVLQDCYTAPASPQEVAMHNAEPAGEQAFAKGCESCPSKDSILDKVRIMPKVTSKLQLTVPKKIADQYGIRPGDELEWIPAGESIRVELMRSKAKNGMRLSPEERLELFDEGTKRLRKREQALLKG